LGKITNLSHHLNPALASRVDLPDGNYALVPEADEGGAEAELQYVELIKDT
jgi:hypothetical protein